MRPLLRRLTTLESRLGAILPMSLRRRHHPVDQTTPARVHRGRDGWEIITHSGIRVHCFTPWYDDCRLLPGGHAELFKKRGDSFITYRFRWCGAATAYTPDHPAETLGALRH